MTKEELERALNSVQAAMDLTEKMETRQRSTWNALSLARQELASHGQEMRYKVLWQDQGRRWRVK